VAVSFNRAAGKARTATDEADINQGLVVEGFTLDLEPPEAEKFLDHVSSDFPLAIPWCLSN